SNVMDTNEHAQDPDARGEHQNPATTWLLPTGALKPPAAGAVAHMSLHQNQQCQRTTKYLAANNHPTRSSPSVRLSVQVGDQLFGAGQNRQRPVGETAYMGQVRTGQRPSAI
ncbi:hypothetical protein, partial [Croceibacterium mercuriale]|uniref:hypothetical protein n=1 Tax=Croceibacterium mercuriale TaxID=1572751 RepID=UPI001F3A772C